MHSPPPAKARVSVGFAKYACAWCPQVSVLLASAEQLPRIDTSPQDVAAWPTLQLTDAQCATNYALMSTLQTCTNLRGGGNPFRFEPEGLPSGEYELRQTIIPQEARTTYYLVSAAMGGAAGGAAVGVQRSNLGILSAHLTTSHLPPQTFPGHQNGNLCVIVVRGALLPMTVAPPCRPLVFEHVDAAPECCCTFALRSAALVQSQLCNSALMWLICNQRLTGTRQM